VGDVIQATFGGTTGYDEALFRQALREEINDNGGTLTHEAIEHAFLRSVEIAGVFKIEAPDQLKEYVDITYALLDRERTLAGEHWRP
jgi:hypothetical protein